MKQPILPKGKNGHDVQGALRPIRTTKINVNSVSNVIPHGLAYAVVRLFATADCHVSFGDSPEMSASTNDMYIPAGVIEYFFAGGEYMAAVKAGDEYDDDGFLYVTEMG